MTERRGVSDRALAMLLVVCLALAAWQVWVLPAVWHDWRAGVPDRFPNEHRNAAFSAISSLAIVVLIPVGLVISRTPPTQRRRRAVLRGVWLVLMSIVVWTLVVRSRD